MGKKNLNQIINHFLLIKILFTENVTFVHTDKKTIKYIKNKILLIYSKLKWEHINKEI